MNAEERIKELLGIPKSYRLYSLVRREREGRKRTYYQVLAYDGRKVKAFHVKVAVEPEVLSLWKEFEKEREQKRKLKELIEKLDARKLKSLAKKLGV